MKLLLKHVLIADEQSLYNGLTKDILIKDGLIEAIEDSIVADAEKVIEGGNITASPGWVDIFAHFSDPGLEYKETLETGAEAAAAGGFVYVLIVPNTVPAISNKAQTEYVVQKSKTLPVHILPLGSITKNIEGKELAEMYDMHNSGAVAFSDGLKPVQTPGLFLKALQYVKAIDGVLVQLPVDNSIGGQGLMNEGITSTKLGLAGVPEISEELMVSRDVELARYTDSNLHITGISTKKSIEIIRKAKADGIKITCSVTPYHLFFCDEDLEQYDTNLKVNPPLRNKEDREALQLAVIDGTVDMIASHHTPQDWDNKTCEFEYAKHGMIGLETSFSVVNSTLSQLTTSRLVDLFSNNARRLFKLPLSSINVGTPAQLTLFNREEPFTYLKEHIKSKSKNSPFINVELKGKVIGVINKDKVYLNQ